MSYEITDEQIAEIERMNVELNELRCVVRYIRVDEVEAIISRLRKAEKDADRYRWLINNWRVQEVLDFILGDDSETVQAYGPLIDTAIKGVALK